MADKGWIKLDRAITDHWIFSDAENFKAWVDLLIMANHENNKVYLREGLVNVKRGQMITSIEKLALRWNWSKSKVYRFLKLLESEQMVKRNSNQFRTLLTIENYGKYQGKRNTNESTDESTNKSTDESTNESRTRMNKNVKNDKECKESAPHYDDDFVSEEEWQKRLAEQDDDW